MRVLFVLLSTALIWTGSLAQAQTLSEQQKLSDLNQLLSLIESGYGPLHYKEKVLGLSVSAIRAKYEPLARATASNGEFYYLLRKLVTEFQDGHFGISVPTDHVASLPIMTDLVNGEVLIDVVDRKELPLSSFPYDRGDAIISIDGVPIKQVLDELQSYVGSGYSLSARRMAAFMVFYRAGSTSPVPSGPVRFEVRRGLSDVIETVELKWIEKGTPLDERIQRSPFLNARWGLSHHGFGVLSMRPGLEALVGRERLEISFACSGGTRIAIPKDATIIMNEPFIAYYHPTEKGNVGYLRIPHYMPMAADEKTPEFDVRLAQYTRAVKILEANTVGLIIDQDHNCGGKADYLEKMVGLFVSRKYQPIQFQFLSNKAEYLGFKNWIAMTPAHTTERDNLEKVGELIRTHWIKGDFMTPRTSMFGAELLEPSPVQYTKPVVMLIDEISGSGGDAFPALLQGYGRATLLGTRTSGLGGHVAEQPPLYYSRMVVHMTKSLFYRPDGVEIENNGAVPDVPYAITRDDFMYGYKGYQRFYLKTLLERIH